LLWHGEVAGSSVSSDQLLESHNHVRWTLYPASEADVQGISTWMGLDILVLAPPVLGVVLVQQCDKSGVSHGQGIL